MRSAKENSRLQLQWLITLINFVQSLTLKITFKKIFKLFFFKKCILKIEHLGGQVFHAKLFHPSHPGWILFQGWSFLKDVLMLTFTFIAGWAHSTGGHFASEGLALVSGYKNPHFFITPPKVRATHTHATHQWLKWRQTALLSLLVSGKGLEGGYFPQKPDIYTDTFF